MRLVGTTRPIHDAMAKACGKAVYAGDMQLPNMLHAAVLFSTIPHGYVRSIDTSKALALPGVVTVLHCFNTTKNLFNRYRNLKGMPVVEQEQIFSEHVRFVGDRIACVVAESPQIARQAVALLEVVYEELPFALCIDEALEGTIDNLHPEGAVYGDIAVEIGTRTAENEALVQTTTQSSLARLSHMTMEPHACVASYDRYMKEITLWCPTQSVHGLRTVMCDLFEFPYEKMRVIKTTMGGSFGAKQEWMLEPVAIAATLQVGQPVKLVFDRAEAMASTISRGPMQGTFTTSATKEGKIVDIAAEVLLDAGAYLSNSVDYLYAFASKFYRCYQFSHVTFQAKAVCTNTPVSGAYRGWSGPEMYLMLEHNFNMTARKLGMDPIQLRLQNVAHPGDYDQKSKQPLGEIRIQECIERGRDLFQWDKKKEENTAFNQQNKRYQRGVGIGCAGHVNGYFPAKLDFTAVDMHMTESGGILLGATLHDHGCGTVTAMQMIAAEELGLAPEKIMVREGDTAYTPLDVGCFASRTTYVIGRAVVECAKKLRQQVLEGIAEADGVPLSSLTMADGFVSCADRPDLRYSYGEAAVHIFRTLQKEVWVQHKFVNQTNPGVTGAHFAHVEVDTYTGMVRLLDYLAVHDIGQAINREMCVGQIQGAVAMGCGAAISENLAVQSRTGRPVMSMKDYHLLNSPELPHIRVELIEDGGTEGPFGAKSIGEVCYSPVAPTMVGAVNDALQSELCALPLNPDAIVALIQQRRDHSCNCN